MDRTLIYWILFWANLRLNRLGHRTLRNLRYQRVQRRYIGGGSVVDAFAHTLFANRFIAGRVTKDEFEGFWTGRASGGLFGQEVEYRRLLRTALATSVRCRRFFITRLGYLGLAPNAAREGDLVCVLWGCSVPVVLRKEGDHYIFVGECYTHGVMDGEAIDMAAAHIFDVKSFVIY